MNNLSEVKEFLLEKEKNILLFEEITQKMLSCPREELDENMQVRQTIITKIDLLDESIHAITEKDPVIADIFLYSRGEKEKNSFLDEEMEICHLIKEIYAVLSRLEETDLQVALRLRLEQEEILEQIKNTNQGNTAKAARFYSSQSGQNTGSSLLRNV